MKKKKKERVALYRLEFFVENSNECTIRMSRRLVLEEDNIASINSKLSDDDRIAKKEKIAVALVRSLPKIKGIKSIHVLKNAIFLSKKKAYRWKDIIPEALETLRHCLGEDSRLKERALPICHVPSELDHVRDIDMASEDVHGSFRF